VIRIFCCTECGARVEDGPGTILIGLQESGVYTHHVRSLTEVFHGWPRSVWCGPLRPWNEGDDYVAWAMAAGCGR